MRLQEIFDAWMALPETDLRTLDEYLEEICDDERSTAELAHETAATEPAHETAAAVNYSEMRLEVRQKFGTTSGPSVETGDMSWAKH